MSTQEAANLDFSKELAGFSAPVEDVDGSPKSLLSYEVYIASLETEKRVCENIKLQVEWLADAKFQQGDFKAAHATSSDTERRAELKAYADALEGIDKPLCKCADVMVTKDGETVPSKRHVQSVYIAKQEKEAAFTGCYLCGGLFAKSGV